VNSRSILLLSLDSSGGFDLRLRYLEHIQVLVCDVDGGSGKQSWRVLFCATVTVRHCSAVLRFIFVLCITVCCMHA